jgi:hypothetical protein
MVTQTKEEIGTTPYPQISRFSGSFCYKKSVLFLTWLTAQPSYEVKAAVEGAYSISKFDHYNVNGGAVNDT